MLRRIRLLLLRFRLRVTVDRVGDNTSSRGLSALPTPSDASAMDYRVVDGSWPRKMHSDRDASFLDVPDLTDLPSFPQVSMPLPDLGITSDATVESPLSDLPVEQLKRGPSLSRAERVLDRQGEALDSNAQGYSALVDTSDAAQALRTGIDSMWEHAQWVMKILDNVAKIHPFVAAPILAFKAVYAMERSRRENDKRLLSLYFAMKEMLVVLIELENIKEHDVHSPDASGLTLASRLRAIADTAADNIKECANACDAYSRKRLLVKVLTGPAWEGRFTEFLDRFAQTRSEFKFALAVHVAKSVVRIRDAIDGVGDKVDNIRTELHDLFREYQSPEEHVIAAKVEEKGGVDYVKQHDMILRELIQYEDNLESAKTKSVERFGENTPAAQASRTHFVKLRPDEAERTAFKSNLANLRSDLREGVHEATARNMETFEPKFDFQLKQIQNAIREENNRVIRRLDAGPHNRILNPELRTIWQEMGWRRNVEANLFATTLRDHFRDQADCSEYHPPFINRHLRNDEWAFEYIGIQYLQQLKEAFDEDCSGYITVREVNRLTQLLPTHLSWSLPHWIAYWTIGWQISGTRYREQIRGLLAQMFALRTHILPENRLWVDNYLEKIWFGTARIVESLLPAKGIPAHVKTRFRAYVSLEERRIAENLESVQCNVDAVETVHMIVQRGKIEHHVLPLIYLLLKRHIKTIRTATRQVIDTEDVFVTAASSLQKVHEAMSTRHRELSTLFQHLGLDISQHMKTFSCELFEYHNDQSSLWSAIHTQIALDQKTSDSVLEGHDLDDQAVDDQEQRPATGYYSPYDIPRQHPTPYDLSTTSPVKHILGEWNGFVYSHQEYPIFLMTSFYVHVSPSNDSDFEASGVHYGTTYQLTGKCVRNSTGVIHVSFTIQYSQEFRTKHYVGYLTTDGSIVGYQGWHHGARQYPFILRRTPAEIMCHRPSPLEFRANKPRALWKFAITAVRNDIRKRSWSWTFFKHRRDTRLRQIEYDIRNYTPYGRPLDDKEREEWAVIRQAMTATDAIFFRDMRDNKLRMRPCHPGKVCDGCGFRIGGARIICLDCQPTDGNYNNTVDFCNDENCLSKPVAVTARSYLKDDHVPSHDIVKVRTVHHFRDMHALDQNARHALKASRLLLGMEENAGNNGRIVNDWSHATSSLYACRKRAARKNETCKTPEDQVEQSPPDLQKIWQINFSRQPSLGLRTEVDNFEGKCKIVSLVGTSFSSAILVKMVPYYDVRAVREPISSRIGTMVHAPVRLLASHDKFACNTCLASRCSLPEHLNSEQHTYVHSLVKCQARDRTRQQQETSSGESINLIQTVESLKEEVMRMKKTIQHLAG
ncbi:hypothetical protein NM688_g3261 [Phlebia brevispora]|uniref:Uncharacterized protein n=1 Tax=Phlebia brevispora TaxID=194682 RepID=A0ACC1T663_9APHY|nr:hypothetical protein NM688_g3261 [Phlebia brevispora]